MKSTGVGDGRVGTRLQGLQHSSGLPGRPSQNLRYPVAADREKARQLCGLHQGKNTVCDFAIHFRTLAAESGWNTTALYDVFLKGLTNPVLERLLPLDLPSDLNSLIALAILTDNRLEEFKELQQERSQTSHLNRSHSAISWTPPGRSSPERGQAAPTQETEEPMQMGRARLSPEERQGGSVFLLWGIRTSCCCLPS